MSSSQRITAAIRKTWESELFRTDLWKHFNTNDIDPAVYGSFLLETYHYTRQSCIIQSSCLPHFQKTNRDLVRPFLKHALEEEPHHRLCLHDLKNLGFDSEALAQSSPLPTTEGYLGYIFNSIANVSALTYLGYLYQLEFMSIELGPIVGKNLAVSKRISPKAMTFVTVHSEDDVEHVDDLAKILDSIGDEKTLEQIEYTAKTSAALYAHMMQNAFLRKL